MRFQLEPGEVVEVEDRHVFLSHELTRLCQEETNPKYRLQHFLRMWTKTHPEHKAEEATLCQALQLYSSETPDCSLEHIQTFRDTCPQLVSVIEEQWSTIQERQVHHLKNVHPTLLRHIITFLQIDYDKRSDTMFDDFKADFMLGNDREAYVHFIHTFSHDDLLKLAVAASPDVLDIPALLQLVACRLGQIMMQMKPQEFRAAFHIPKEFSEPVFEQARQLVASHPWTALQKYVSE